MNVDEFVYDALAALISIATSESHDAGLRVSAAEKILDYAVRRSENNIATEVIGFTMEEQSESDSEDDE